MGLAFTPPEPEEGLRCHYDAGNYQLTVEPIIWRNYEQSLYYSTVYSSPEVDCASPTCSGQTTFLLTTTSRPASRLLVVRG
jgi:hypothetical protein